MPDHPFLTKLMNEFRLKRSTITTSGIKPEAYEPIHRLFTLFEAYLHAWSEGWTPFHGFSTLSSSSQAKVLRALSGDVELYTQDRQRAQSLDHGVYEELGFCAALSGKIEALAWVKNHYPDLLVRKRYNTHTDKHYTIVDCAIYSPTCDAFQWVCDEVPMAQFTEDLLDKVIKLQSADFLNVMLSLSRDPSTLHTTRAAVVSEVLISEVLDVNYTLTHVYLTQSSGEDLLLEYDEETQAKLERNRKIQRAIQALKLRTNTLSEAELFFAFSKAMPETVPLGIMLSIFQISRLNIDTVLAFIHDELYRLSSIPNNDKLIALMALKKIVEQHTPQDELSLSAKVALWDERHCKVIDQKDDILTDLYSTIWEPIPSPTRMLLNKIKNLLRASSPTVAADAVGEVRLF